MRPSQAGQGMAEIGGLNRLISVATEVYSVGLLVISNSFTNTWQNKGVFVPSASKIEPASLVTIPSLC
jgi:hypothetical protein